jgi:hypothetical protein
MNLKNFLGTAALLMSSQAVLAVPFEPTFSDYAFPGSQYTVDTAANTFFSANYGITIDNAYLYRDGRDTFDGIGVSVGEVPDVGTPQTGTITFCAYDSLSNLVDSFTIGANQLGTHLFNAPGRISYLTWSSNGGFGQVTGLRYDYDGVTDGRNDDLPPTSVPEPSPFLLLGLMLAGLGFMRSKKA